MAGEDDDPPWENEFGDNAPTKLDAREAVPEAVPSKDSTGKYKTLPGFADAVELTREHYLAMGEIRGIKRVLTAFRLAMIQSGTSPEVAFEQMDRLQRWMAVNDELIRAAMNGGS
jgi:hypothetical protein